MPTILCIDDNAAGLATRKALLERMGYSVLTAEDGVTGLALLFAPVGGPWGKLRSRSERIDAVILDYRMPGMDGTAVARLIRNELPDLPIILLTGFPQDISESSVLDFVDAFITKGEHPQLLLTTLEQLIGTKPKKPPARISSALEEARKARAIRAERRALRDRRVQSDRRRSGNLSQPAERQPAEEDSPGERN